MAVFGFEEREALAHCSVSEKRAMMRYIMSVVYVDGNPSSNKVAIANEICRGLYITETDMNAVQTLDWDLARRTIINNLSEIQRCYWAKLMANIIMADGYITPKSQQLWNYYNSMFDIERLINKYMP